MTGIPQYPVFDGFEAPQTFHAERPSVVRFVQFTEVEGGKWLDCDFTVTESTLVPMGGISLKAVCRYVSPDGERCHAMKCSDGRIWDVISGWRP